MPKPSQDLRVSGISFEDAVKRMIKTPPVTLAKPGKNPAHAKCKKTKVDPAQ